MIFLTPILIQIAIQATNNNKVNSNNIILRNLKKWDWRSKSNLIKKIEGKMIDVLCI